MKMAVNLIFENQPPYVALSYRVKSRHMVVFLTAEIVLLPQGMINPRFLDRGRVIMCGSPLPASTWASKPRQHGVFFTCSGTQKPPPMDNYGYYTMGRGEKSID